MSLRKYRTLFMAFFLFCLALPGYFIVDRFYGFSFRNQFAFSPVHTWLSSNHTSAAGTAWSSQRTQNKDSTNVTSTNVTSVNVTSINVISLKETSVKTALPHVPLEKLFSDPSLKLLCIELTGRLGNEMFEYASTIGLALSLNRAPVFYGNMDLRKVLRKFPLTSSSIPNYLLRYRCMMAKAVKESSCCKFEEEFTKLDPKFDYRVEQYLQSYRYFDDHKHYIRQALTFNDVILHQTNRIVSSLRQQYSSNTLIGIHVRRGDFLKPIHQQVGYPITPPEFLHRAIRYFCGLYPGCVLVVASDSLAWCRANLPTNHTLHFLSDNPPAVDMTVLTSMDHVITTFGTFSWWVGYLNPGRTVYMKDFIRPGTELGQMFYPDGKDYVYPSWVPL